MIFEYINEMSLKYPLVGSTISLLVAGSTMYFLKDLPKTIYYKIKSQIFTTVLVSNEDFSIFSTLKRHLSNKDPFLNRLYKISASYGKKSGNYFLTPIGSSFILKIEGKWCKISYGSTQLHAPIEKESKIVFEREFYNITYFGRNIKFANNIKNFLCNLEKQLEDPTKIEIITTNGYTFSTPQISDKRTMDSVILNNELKNKIKTLVKFYLENKDFYVTNGIPYRLNLLFHGPPGTGKTSLIKALASEFNLPLYVVRSDASYESLAGFMSGINPGIIAFEDIDSNRNLLIERELESNIPLNNSSLSSVLNFFDGINAPQGFICILTTNHIDKIVPALTRSQRMHLVLEIPPITIDDIPNHLKEFMKEGETSITGAKLQERYLESKMKSQ